MKRATLLHGTDGNPTHNWQPWLKTELEKSGYTVFAPELPGNHAPDQKVYEAFLQKSGWNFADNILVGHSSGATTVLNLLLSDWFPHVKTVVLCSSFLNERLVKEVDWYEAGQFDNLLRDPYNAEQIKNRADRFYFVHGSDDPLCDIEDARKFCTELDGTFITIENGGHLSEKAGVFSLPELTDRMKSDGVL